MRKGRTWRPFSRSGTPCRARGPRRSFSGGRPAETVAFELAALYNEEGVESLAQNQIYGGTMAAAGGGGHLPDHLSKYAENPIRDKYMGKLANKLASGSANAQLKKSGRAMREGAAELLVRRRRRALAPGFSLCLTSSAPGRRSCTARAPTQWPSARTTASSSCRRTPSRSGSCCARDRRQTPRRCAAWCPAVSPEAASRWVGPYHAPLVSPPLSYFAAPPPSPRPLLAAVRLVHPVSGGGRRHGGARNRAGPAPVWRPRHPARLGGHRPLRSRAQGQEGERGKRRRPLQQPRRRPEQGRRGGPFRCGAVPHSVALCCEVVGRGAGCAGRAEAVVGHAESNRICPISFLQL